jgi:hypothetical protein
MDAKAEAARAEQLEARLAGLREINEPEAAAGIAHAAEPAAPIVDRLDLRSEERVEGRKLVGFRNGRPVYRRTSRVRSVDFELEESLER